MYRMHVCTCMYICDAIILLSFTFELYSINGILSHFILECLFIMLDNDLLTEIISHANNIIHYKLALLKSDETISIYRIYLLKCFTNSLSSSKICQSV